MEKHAGIKRYCDTCKAGPFFTMASLRSHTEVSIFLTFDLYFRILGGIIFIWKNMLELNATVIHVKLDLSLQCIDLENIQRLV